LTFSGLPGKDFSTGQTCATREYWIHMEKPKHGGTIPCLPKSMRCLPAHVSPEHGQDARATLAGPCPANPAGMACGKKSCGMATALHKKSRPRAILDCGGMTPLWLKTGTVPSAVSEANGDGTVPVFPRRHRLREEKLWHGHSTPQKPRPRTILECGGIDAALAKNGACTKRSERSERRRDCPRFSRGDLPLQ
jgi:hypothetical protein